MFFFFFSGVATLPETNRSHLKMDGWKTFGFVIRPIFSFREGLLVDS